MTSTHAFGGWQRIGVVFSVLWLVAVSAYAFFVEYLDARPGNSTIFVVWFDAERRVYADYQWKQQRFIECDETCPGKKTDLAKNLCSYSCVEGKEANLEKRIYWLGYSSIAAGPIIFFWLVVSTWVIRWIGRGFQSKGT
jgi:hypothetical protein